MSATPHFRTRLAVGLLGAVFVIVAATTFATGAAFGVWVTSDTSNPAVAEADVLGQGATPSAPTNGGTGGTTVAVNFAQVSTTEGGVPIAAYDLKRYPAGGGGAVVVVASCSVSSGTVTCHESTVPNGSWRYTDTPIYGKDWVGRESAKSPSIVVDTTPPTASAPRVSATTTYGSDPIFVTNEDLTITDSPVAGSSGVATVAYYYCTGASGACAASTPWTQIGSSSTGPGYPVTWAPPLPAACPCRVVAVSTDSAGSAGSPGSPTVVSVDTTPPTVGRPGVNGAS